MKSSAKWLVALAAMSMGAAQATPLMSAEWAAAACEAWNADPVLTDKLAEGDKSWIRNDKGRGYKIMQVYRSDCKDSPRAEMKIANQDGKAWCVYGGAVQNEPDTDVDYVMNASTKNWGKMGRGDLGPMGAMMTFRLKFSGPKWEAMSNMGPFENFLLLTGKVPGEINACP